MSVTREFRGQDHWRRATAWLTCAVTVLLVVAAFVIQLRSPSGHSWTGGTSILTFIHPLISVLVGAIIIDRKGHHVVGWLFCLSGLSSAVYHLAMSYASYLPKDGHLPWERQMLWSSTWTFFAAYGLAPVLAIFVFPTGRLTSPRWRGFFAAGVGAIAIGSLGAAFAPGPMEDLPAIDNPYGVAGSVGEVMAIMRDLGWPLLLLSIAAGVWSLRVRARRATSEERQQIKWVLLGGMVLVAFVLFWGVMETLGHPSVPEVISGLFLPLIPLAVGIAILRYRLYDIDLLINKTLVYASLSAVLAFLYLGAVILLQRLLSPLTAESDLAIGASTLAVAALFRPLRSQIQRFIDRRFYRSKYDAASTLEHFSNRLRDQIDLDALTKELLTVVGQTLQPSYTGLWLKTTDTAESPASEGGIPVLRRKPRSGHLMNRNGIEDGAGREKRESTT